MGLFNKIEHHAGKLFNKAMGHNNIFNKVYEYARKGDNSVARVGHFIRPIASHFGLEDVVHGVVNCVHDVASNIRNVNNSIRNGLERAVKAPIADIHKYLIIYIQFQKLFKLYLIVKAVETATNHTSIM